MRLNWYQRSMALGSLVLMGGMVGCDSSDSTAGGVVAIVQAVFDLVLGIIEVSS
jgi:hypothetical protein